MKRFKFVGLALVAACAMSVLAVSSASASEFKSTETGALTAKVLETQKFNTKAGLVECKALTLTSGTAALSSEKQHVTIQYTNCKAFGLAATISPALYLFLAGGTVHIQSPITVNAGAGTCLVLVPAQPSLSSVVYSNAGKSIIITPAPVKSIKYTTEGSGCPVKVTNASDGTYEGKSLVGLASGVGTLEWK